jgi:hypothetical protein
LPIFYEAIDILDLQLSARTTASKPVVPTVDASTLYAQQARAGSAWQKTVKVD